VAVVPGRFDEGTELAVATAVFEMASSPSEPPPIRLPCRLELPLSVSLRAPIPSEREQEGRFHGEPLSDRPTDGPLAAAVTEAVVTAFGDYSSRQSTTAKE